MCFSAKHREKKNAKNLLVAEKDAISFVHFELNYGNKLRQILFIFASIFVQLDFYAKTNG